MITGIMLSVAVIVLVDLVSANAGKAFDLRMEVAAGKATH
jgi:hypothetical protein